MSYNTMSEVILNLGRPKYIGQVPTLNPKKKAPLRKGLAEIVFQVKLDHLVLNYKGELFSI